MNQSWDLGSMFLLGLFGTGHCIGMCGPLVLALPAQRGRLNAHLPYHLGRVITYIAVGAVVGAIGAGTTRLAGTATGGDLVAVTRTQEVVSLVAAALLLWFGLARLRIVGEPRWLAIASPARLPGFKRVRDAVAAGKGGVSLLLFGLLLGLLPCGHSLGAFARALPAGGPLEGGLLVAAFGLGTVPGLVLFGAVGSVFARRYKRTFDVLSGAVLVAMAVMLAQRVLFSPGPAPACH